MDSTYRTRPHQIRLALLIIVAVSGVADARALENQFDYELGLEERFEKGTIRSGNENRDDRLTSAFLDLRWRGKAPRASVVFHYLPRYYDYADLDELDNLEHLQGAAWQFDATPRSTLGVRQQFSSSEQQRSFQVLDSPEPVVPGTKRTVWFVQPFYSLQINRLWTMDLLGNFRSERFDRDALTDSDRVKIETQFMRQISRGHQLGVRVETEHVVFDLADEETQGFDDFNTIEAVWSGQSSKLFSWQSEAGLYVAEGKGVDTEVNPTFGLALNWGFKASRLIFGYNLGYSASGGFSTGTRSHNADLTYLRRWGRGLETSIGGGYLSREPFEGQGVATREVEGFEVGAQVSYAWQNGLGIRLEYNRIDQNVNTGDQDLDREFTAVSLFFSSPSRSQHGDVISSAGSGV